ENYLMDTHTSVAVNVYGKYLEETGDNTPVLIASTASPYKFSNSVLEAIVPTSEIPENEFEMVEKLNSVTSTPVPKPIAELKDANVRFNNVTDASSMADFVKKSLGI
ncbi:MAG: threonine synthase, partial [Acutalibacteraceae bacterium]